MAFQVNWHGKCHAKNHGKYVKIMHAHFKAISLSPAYKANNEAGESVSSVWLQESKAFLC